jgi:putative protein-disulfide isomerase
MSGLPFNRDAFMALDGFVYDTEPVCRAVVTARRYVGNEGLLRVFRALQNGFYAEGRNTTDGHVLADIAVNELRAQGIAVSADEFYEAWADAETVRETQQDFVNARALGVSSFPTLLLQDADRVFALSPGYASVDELEHRLRQLEGKLA